MGAGASSATEVLYNKSWSIDVKLKNDKEQITYSFTDTSSHLVKVVKTDASAKSVSLLVDPATRKTESADGFSYGADGNFDEFLEILFDIHKHLDEKWALCNNSKESEKIETRLNLEANSQPTLGETVVLE